MKLNEKIYYYRKRAKLSQEELADAVEVTRQTIISLENGRYNASLLLAHKIAKYFGSSIEEIFCSRRKRHEEAETDPARRRRAGRAGPDGGGGAFPTSNSSRISQDQGQRQFGRL